MLESSDHQFIVSQLRIAIQGLTAAHTFSFGGMGGGLWPQLLDTVAAAPALTHLIIDNMPWLGVSRGVFDFPTTSRLPPLRRFAYIAPHAIDENDNRPRKMKRPPHMLESEVHNLRVVLRTCHSSLESLTLPAELILLSLDVSLEWNGLRELQLVGYWPDRAELSLYSVLLALPNLRILSLRHQSATSGHRDPIVPGDILASASEIFLPQLRQFEVATLVQEECVLSILPPGLEKLSVIVYPERYDYRYPSNIRRASEFLGMLAGVYLPAVTHLQLWYQTDASDNIFLHRLPAVFPSLRTLEIHRFMGQNMDDEWNPAVRVGLVVCESCAYFMAERVPDAAAALEGSSCLRHRTRLSKPTAQGNAEGSRPSKCQISPTTTGHRGGDGSSDAMASGNSDCRPV